MTGPELGRLERVDPRGYWTSEASDFTPWLAQNINVLGEALSIDLELEAQEKNVGPFRADILCKDTVTNHFVLIENQLDATDHTHLGQLMTYAAGLDAVTIIWVAKQFREEHRAALDWLNRTTGSGINFFGVEIELWRIGTSPPAPKFNIVSRPNGWTGSVRAAAASGENTPVQQLHFDFWSELKNVMDAAKSPVRLGAPWAGHYTRAALGKAGIALIAWNGMNQNTTSSVYVECVGPNAKAYFYLLRDKHGQTIERELGPVQWREQPLNQASQIAVVRSSTPADKKTWPELLEWFRVTLERWNEVFRPIVKTLDASEYVPDVEAPTELDEITGAGE